MTVTVLLTVYNSGQYLPQAIASVLGQSFEDFELLIMDDGSTDMLVDATLAAIDDPRVTIHRLNPTPDQRRESCRYAKLINNGADCTTGEYVTFLCGDDYYMPDRLERMVATLDLGRDVVYGSQLLLDAHGKQTGHRGTLGTLNDAWHLVDLNSVMQTRSSFATVGGFPTSPDLWRDADAHYWRKLTTAGFRFFPVAGGPTDCKRYRDESVDARVQRGEEPWG